MSYLKPTEGFIVPGKANMIIDGQFGSTGKGLIAARISKDNHIDIACARLSPNAGHTFYCDSVKYVTKQLPVSGILCKKSMIYIGFGSVIDPEILKEEIDRFNIDPSRIIIHPRTCVVTPFSKNKERSTNFIQIASTQSGTGISRCEKIARTSDINIAQGNSYLRRFISDDFDLEDALCSGYSILMESGQGFDLSLNVGYSYPYCTSIDVIPSAILADFGLHPSFMGNCMLSLRTFPIRVGNPFDSFGNVLGYSGPAYEDSKEITWEELQVPVEYTTVTNRIRRVFTFSKIQYLRALKYIKPTHTFLNFINYLRPQDKNIFSFLSEIPNLFVGYGKLTDQVSSYADYSKRYDLFSRETQ